MPSAVRMIDIPDTDIWTTIFDRKTKAFPDSQVIYHDPFTSRQYTFASLRRSTISFSHSLQNHPSIRLKKRDVLAIFSTNCIDTPAVIWATHYAGGIVSPANPGYGVRELAFHLKDSGAKVLATQKLLLKTAVAAAQEVGLAEDRIILIGDETEHGFTHFSELAKERKDGGARGERAQIDAKKDLAFLVYSSGTTGLPKGVMLSHRNVVADLLMVESSEGKILNWERDRILAVLPYYHIYGLQCLVHLPAYTGITTVVMSSFTLPKFCSLIQNHKITYTYVAPPVVLHLAKSAEVSNYDLSSLRMITSGAAPLSQELIHAVHSRLGTEVKQAYGLSETSPVTHIQKHWDKALGSNGPPLPNQIVKFMSPDGREVENGTEGELWIAGPNVFMGYHNNPSATTECKTSDGLFFKTGDVGYEDAEGNMYVTDRVKEIIKYKGFQVAPAELEGVLSGMEEVLDCAVIGVWDKERESEVPLACVVSQENGDDAKERIQEWIRTRTANHKWLRGGVVFVDEVPKSASGKILRRLLKEKIGRERPKEQKLQAKL